MLKTTNCMTNGINSNLDVQLCFQTNQISLFKMHSIKKEAVLQFFPTNLTTPSCFIVIKQCQLTETYFSNIQSNLLENLIIVCALFSCRPRGCSNLAIAAASPRLAESGLGHLFRNLQSNGMAAEPVNQ